ncbi:MAG: hypothetical protein IPM10_00255 [Chitinophagaceae bacterium]|nr:hypothetical protein [Chitinophagaceae bacterium]
MKILFSFIVTIASLHTLNGQDAGIFIKEGEQWEVQMNEKSAIERFKQAIALEPTNVYVLCKISELYSRIGNREASKSTRDSYYTNAVAYAKKALSIAPANDEANVAMAIAYGRIALTKSGKEKVGLVKEIKHYADVALVANKQNFKAWHILGKWHYEVSSLNMVERTAVRIFYGGLPDASFKKSITCYEVAKKLKAGFILNYLELAKAYYKNNETSKSLEQLRILLALPITTQDDNRIKTEASLLIKKWS